MQKKFLIILAGTFFLFIVLIGTGINLWFTQIISRQASPIYLPQESKLVIYRKAVIYGTVAALEKPNVTVEKEGEKITISLADNARLVSLVAPKDDATGGQPPINIEFKDLKVGDTVWIHLDSNGNQPLIGKEVIVAQDQNAQK